MLRRAMTWMAALVIATLSLGPTVMARETPDPLRVVSTFSILHDLVQNVGGDAIETHVLVGAGVDAHTYEPPPADVARVADADLILAIGLDFEPWLTDLLASSGTDATEVVVSERVPLLRFDGDQGHETEELEAGEGEDPPDESEEAAAGTAAPARGEYDPHSWQDVTNTIIVVETIRDALVAADPANAATYEANAAAYITELEALDAWVIEQVATLPEDQRKLVTSHETLGYYANRYGFEIVGTAFGTLSTEAGDPSAAAIARLVAEIQAQNVNAIFAENVSNPDLMEAVAAEAGVTLAPTLYTDALGAPGTGAETYIDLIRTNTNEIVTALSGE